MPAFIRESRRNVMKHLLIPLIGLLWLIAGCDEQGPAERAGESIDEAAEQARESAENLRDRAEELIEDARDSQE
jgi:hypothetical protein